MTFDFFARLESDYLNESTRGYSLCMVSLLVIFTGIWLLLRWPLIESVRVLSMPVDLKNSVVPQYAVLFDDDFNATTHHLIENAVAELEFFVVPQNEHRRLVHALANELNAPNADVAKTTIERAQITTPRNWWLALNDDTKAVQRIPVEKVIRITTTNNNQRFFVQVLSSPKLHSYLTRTTPTDLRMIYRESSLLETIVETFSPINSPTSDPIDEATSKP